MIEILHKTTGVVLHKLEADTFKHAQFFEVNLDGADVSHQKLDGADFTLASLNDADFMDSSCMNAVFYSVHMQRADLSRARLWGMNGDGADLRHAVLVGAQMEAAWLRHASLSHADLREADLKAVYLGHASLRYADLRGANLSETILHRTDLKDARLAGATLCSTVFANCANLHTVEGLSEVKHAGASSLDHATLRACGAYLPDVFLLGTGYTEDELHLLRVMYPSK